MDVRERRVLYYLRDGRAEAPFRTWRDRISDQRAKLAVTARIARLRGGNFGDSKPIGDGASENRINFGPGYRIYHGIDGNDIVLLLGGDKSTQHADIQKARIFWRDHKEQRREQK